MTENTNPKPFNISRQLKVRARCRTAILGLSINQSITQSTDPFTVKLDQVSANAPSKTIKNVKGSFTD